MHEQLTMLKLIATIIDNASDWLLEDIQIFCPRLPNSHHMTSYTLYRYWEIISCVSKIDNACDQLNKDV
jgi:hypothetical protein